MATDQVCSCGASQFEGAAHKPPCVGLGARDRDPAEDRGHRLYWRLVPGQVCSGEQHGCPGVLAGGSAGGDIDGEGNGDFHHRPRT